jgi:hypothetical protein
VAAGSTAGRTRPAGSQGGQSGCQNYHAFVSALAAEEPAASARAARISEIGKCGNASRYAASPRILAGAAPGPDPAIDRTSRCELRITAPLVHIDAFRELSDNRTRPG